MHIFFYHCAIIFSKTIRPAAPLQNSDFIFHTWKCHPNVVGKVLGCHTNETFLVKSFWMQLCGSSNKCSSHSAQNSGKTEIDKLVNTVCRHVLKESKTNWLSVEPVFYVVFWPKICLIYVVENGKICGQKCKICDPQKG